MSHWRNPEDIVRRFTYDPTGTDPAPEPPQQKQPQKKQQLRWKRTLLWMLAAVGFVGLVLLVTGKA